MSEVENKLDVNCRTLAKFCVVINVWKIYLLHSCYDRSIDTATTLSTGVLFLRLITLTKGSCQ